MRAFLRTLLVAAALLSSGVLQIASAMGDDACCAGETEETDGCPSCPPGLACACCPFRGAVERSFVMEPPVPRAGVAIVVTAAEPAVGAPATDIFHPPRA